MKKKRKKIVVTRRTKASTSRGREVEALVKRASLSQDRLIFQRARHISGILINVLL
jgi:hypothetical protein